MTITCIADLNSAYEAGRSWTGYMRKVHSIVANTFPQDLSYAAGIPVANYYASTPLLAAALGYNDGIYSGPPASPYKKYLHKILYQPASTIGQATFHFHDIVMYYPFVDGDGGSQDLTNSISIPRYSGEKCRIMVTCQGAGVAATSNAYITYTNTAGVQKTMQFYLNGVSLAGQIPNAYDVIAGGVAAGSTFLVPALHPYLPLGQGDTGIRSIDNIDIRDSVGGIYAFSIVKPLGIVSMQEASTAPIEVDFARDRFSLPEVGDGATIYAVGRATTTGTNAISIAELHYVWG